MSALPRWPVALLAATLTLVVGGCAISVDDTPRDITGGARRELLSSANPAGATTGSARIYLVVPSQTTAGVLRAVARDVQQTPTDVLTALFAGPNDGERRDQITSAIPAGTTLNSAQLTRGVLRVDISGPVEQLSGEARTDAVAQIVLTATEVAGIQSVEIVVDGQTTEWPDGSGELRAGPLTRYDFPGLVESSQPDFPVVPSVTIP